MDVVTPPSTVHVTEQGCSVRWITHAPTPALSRLQPATTGLQEWA